MKLQKLVYYCQAWHLVWDDEPLFVDEIQAWANGPVIPVLYQAHRGQFKVGQLREGNAAILSQSEEETIDAICESYGKLSASQLSELTHREDPWRNARVGLHPGERGNKIIGHDSMAEYYGSLSDEA